MRKGQSFRHPAEGATFLGTMVAIALLAALVGVAYPFLSAAVGAIERAIARGSGAAKASVLSASVLTLASRVLPPFWAPPAGTADGNGVSWCWIDGDPASTFSVSADDDSIVVEADGAAFAVTGLESPEVTWLEGSDGAPFGLSVRFSSGGVEYGIDAAFGAFPYVPEAGL
ncbi:MAG: hypothetical protein JXA15_13865 [Spirochaetales bacterium]|nr:hypothetical protein [Spirochaetales bacterium]